MCLILLAHRVHPTYPLILLANRDEDHARPTATAHFWSDENEVLGGRDLVANGTWLGINKTGRWSAISNLRYLTPHRPDSKSRGHLVKEFLTSQTSVDTFITEQQKNGHQYNGYNLLLGQLTLPQSEVVYLTNAQSQAINFSPGIYGVSNHILGTNWSKVVEGKRRLTAIIDQEQIKAELLLDIMKQPGNNTESAIFVANSHYGTRSTTLILVDQHGNVLLIERTYHSTDGADPEKDSDITFQFRINLR